LPTLIAALLLVAHGLVHAFFLIPQPPEKPGSPAWPFSLDRSWVLAPLGVGARTARIIGIALLVVLVAGYGVGAVALVDWLPAGVFAPAITVGSVASLAMLALFFHPWLGLGFAIDIVLLWAVLANGWQPPVPAP
jgi:hypothetical protein